MSEENRRTRANLHLRLTDSQHRQTKQLAKLRGKPMMELVREAWVKELRKIQEDEELEKLRARVLRNQRYGTPAENAYEKQILLASEERRRERLREEKGRIRDLKLADPRIADHLRAPTTIDHRDPESGLPLTQVVPVVADDEV